LRLEPIDRFAVTQSDERRAAVRLGATTSYDKRTEALFADYEDPNRLRALAGRIKQHAIDHLDRHLEQAEARLRENGAHVHYASDAESACRRVLEILQRRGAKAVVKTKTMVSEEIRLAEFLERHGIESLETDLGEFVVQLGKDHPSHIVKPIIHKNRREVAEIFEREGLGAYDDTPEVITRRARVFLRKKYLRADAGLSGANFVSAESGRLVLVTNEGNSRFCLAATRCHIALVGIEKLVATDRDLSVLLNLLARSATGQQLTVYTEFLSGPREPGQPDGPDEMHVVFIDNGRTAALASDCHEILRCIRCGACLNVCPVYRQASGHAYRSVYPGPVGAVLTPLLAERRFDEFADLPRASSLCGACHEVCPVDIPLEDLLLRQRARGKAAGHASPAAPPWGAWALVASEPLLWRAALASGKLLDALPEALRPPAVRGFAAGHELPEWRGGAFRRWLAEREHRPKGKPTPDEPSKDGVS
jgi:L-lactate dehydrogenase complex protein LldF